MKNDKVACKNNETKFHTLFTNEGVSEVEKETCLAYILTWLLPELEIDVTFNWCPPCYVPLFCCSNHTIYSIFIQVWIKITIHKLIRGTIEFFHIRGSNKLTL